MGYKAWCCIALSALTLLFETLNPSFSLKGKREDLFQKDALIWVQQNRSDEAKNNCALEEVSSARHSRFVSRIGSASSHRSANWFQLGILRSCCAADRCQVKGGDVFLAYLDGQTTPRALTQASIQDLGTGSYVLLLPGDTLLPGGTYTLSIYLHEALNRSAWNHAGDPPLADPQGEEDRLDAFDLQAAGTSGDSDLRDLRAVYGRPTSVEPIKVTVQWRHNEDLKDWKRALSNLPRCGHQSTQSRREGGFWLRLDGKQVTCAGVGLRGCGAFSLLQPDSSFRHVYLERNCYYPLRNDRYIQKCLADKKVLLHGDSTTHGLLQEAIGMWSEVKPHKDPANKSDVCRFNAAAAIHDGEEIPRNSWTSDYCNFRGESLLHDVILNGRSVIAAPKQYFRKPRCHGLKNLEDEAVFVRFVAMLQDFDVLVMHSCDHDLCNEGVSKHRLLDEYRRHLNRFAKVMRKHAANKRIIWLSCSAQSGLASVTRFSQMQVLKWRMDRLALEMCQQNGWEFLDGFSLYSSALLRVRWFDHLGREGDLHTHSHCCPRGSLAELEELRKEKDQLPYRLAYQGGVGYLSRMLVQMLFNQICLPAARPLVKVKAVEGTLPESQILPCELWERSKAESSRFQMEKGPPFYRVGEVKTGWLQLGLLRSCCGEFRCQQTGGDVFLAYLDGLKAPRALAQPTIHDFGNGSYALLLPEETLLPSGTYSLQIFLHQALNRSAYQSSVGSSAPWPIADILGMQDLLDSFDARLANSPGSRVDWQSIYLHLPSNISVSTPLVQWQWRHRAGGLEDWRKAVAALPLCQGQRKSSKRQGGLWLQLGQKHLPCEGLGRQGCGAFDLLFPDTAFHHVYVERDCYYLLRDKHSIGKCLGDQKVLLHGDSTVHGLLQEGLEMWSDIKPFKNARNKSFPAPGFPGGFCSENLTYVRRKGRYVTRWSSPLCNQRGESVLNDVVLDGRRVISAPAQFFRTPQCQGLANLADASVAARFAELLKPYDVLMLHSCSHDLCNQNYAKPRLLENYGKNLQRLAKILRRHAKNKRIIWLSCAAQSGLKYTWKSPKRSS